MRKFRLTIESYDVGSELEGRPGEWREVGRVFAEITPLSGREYLQAQQMQASVTHRIRSEYLAGMTARMRLTHGTRVFSVASVVNVDEKCRELEWMCTEVV